MTNDEVKEYIKENGEPELVLETLKAMQTEGAEMSIDELHKRISLVKNPPKEQSPQKPEKKDTAGMVLTIIAVVLFVVLMVLLIVIITMQKAPDSKLALHVDEIIYNITRQSTTQG